MIYEFNNNYKNYTILYFVYNIIFITYLFIKNRKLTTALSNIQSVTAPIALPIT
jgi:hypothetical protein